MFDIKDAKEQAEKELREEITDDAKDQIKEKLREIKCAQSVVTNLKRELEDLYVELSQDG